MRSLVIAIAAALLWPGSALAERIGSDGNAFVDVDYTGAPIIAKITPVLEPDTTYEFETYDLAAIPGSSFADTVMSIAEGTLTTTAILAGADSCDSGAFEYKRSCFTFHVDPSAYPSARNFALWVRAWRSNTFGTTRIRYRELGTSTWIEITSGPRTFGGYVVQDPGPDMLGWIEFQTTSQPGTDPACGDGGNCDRHVIRFTGANYDTSVNWNYPAHNGSWPTGDPFSLERGSGGTAHFQYVGGWLDFPSGVSPDTVIAGSIYPIAAPFRLIRNTAVDGSDDDEDGIGLEVERILGTCDRQSQPTCDSLPHCTGFSTDRCTASLRDSDGDGIRDDAEVFGVDESVMLDGNDLPRYGADPARYDIFVELDNRGQPSGPGGACVPEKPRLTQAELSSVADVFRRVPVSNRDGTTGIHAHFDAGYAPSDTTLDSIFGDRMGSDACLIPDGDPYGVGMEDHRRWIWRHMVRQSGGSMKHFQLSGSFRDAAALVHELGHSGGLAHFGPLGVRDQFNGKPNHVSRANYVYQNAGGGNLDGPYEDRIPFSTGIYASQPIAPLWVDETVRYDAIGRIDLLESRARFVARISYHSSDDTFTIDFDRNNVEDTFTQAAVTPVDTHIQRQTLVNRRDAANECDGTTYTERFAHRRGGDLGVAGDLMVWAKIEMDPQSGDSSLRAYVNDGMYCGVQEVPESDPMADLWRDCSDVLRTPHGFPACWDADPASPDPSLVLTHTDGTEIRPMAVAVNSAGVSSFVVVYVELEVASASLRYGVLVPDGSPAGLAWYDKGPVPGAASLTPPLDADGGAWGVSLAGLGSYEDYGYMLLTYRSATDEVMQQYLQLVDVDAVDWWAAAPAVAVGGIPIVIDSGSLAAPATVRSSHAYGDGVTMVAPQGDWASGNERLTIFHRDTLASEWSKMSTVNSSAGVRGRPAVAQVPYQPGNRLVIVWTGRSAAGTNNHLLQYAETFYDDYQVLLQERLHGKYHAAMDPVMVWDDRTSVYPPGLRLVYGQWVGCSNVGDPCDAETTCTAIFGTSTGGKFCDSGGWFGQIREFLLPFADGVFPAMLRDYDETSMLDYGLCRALRKCTYAGGTCIPPEYQDLGGGLLTMEPCGDLPEYY